MILSSGVIGLLAVESALFGMAIIANLNSSKIAKKWNFSSTNQLQYELEKRAFFVSSTINLLLYAKLVLIFYLIYLLDSLVPYVKAAMCAVGVINATNSGWWLLIIKIFNLYLFGLWLLTDRLDKQKLDYPYTRLKFRAFLGLFVLLLLEYLLLLNTFLSLDTQRVVSCCSITFANSNLINQMIELSRIKVGWILGLFFGIYLIAWLFRKRAIFIFGLISLLFGAIGLLGVIYFISPYIYELPTHNCPFCLIQKEYHYIGYPIYALLFSGSYFGVEYTFSKLVLKEHSNKDYYSLLFCSAFIALGFGVVLEYYFKNGTWL